jgi:ABC-2 type transport system permease protein
VADVSRRVGVMEQVRLIAGLRWRILRNTLRRKQTQLDLIGLVVIGIMAGLFVLGVCFAFFAGAYHFLSAGKAGWMGILFWAIFVWWQLFPLFVAGFGASFEFRTLLRFPLRFQAFYGIGLAYGLADFAAVASVCWLVSMVLGAWAAASAGWAMLVVALLFVLLNVTLERLVGSWLERLLARRRARELFFALFILAMICLQLTGPLLSRYGDSAAPWAVRLLPYLAPLPPSLAGSVIVAASMKQWGAVLLGIAGLFGYILVFGILLWRRFAAQFRGEELSEATAPMRVAPRPLSVAGDRGGTLDLFSPQVAAMIRKEFRYLTRNGFAALLLFLPPLLVFLLISRASLMHFADSKRGISTDTFFPGLMAYIILILMAPAYNSFAYENTGVQTYFMAPLGFRNVFLGKNFVHVCLIITELTLCMGAFFYRVGWPSAPVCTATLAALVFVVIGQLTIANWSSLSFPRKLAFGQLHGQRQSGMAALTAFGAQLLLFAIAGPILMLSRWTGERWLPAEIFAFLAAAAIAGYSASLDALTRYAETKKEKLIEALCR